MTISDTEYRAALRHLPHVQDVAAMVSLPDSRLAREFVTIFLGLGSALSGWGTSRKKSSRFGLMQIDGERYPTFVGISTWRDPAFNIARGTNILLTSYRHLAARGIAEPDLTPAAIAGYEDGPGAVYTRLLRGKEADVGGFAVRVLARAEAYAERLAADFPGVPFGEIDPTQTP